jgi:two-component system, sensor histidine kinase and response regulator
MFELFPLDPKTVFLLYFWANLFICILIFSYSFSYATSDNKKILKMFGYGKLLLTIGWILIALRNIILDFISINIANTFIFSACCYETIAMLYILRIKSKSRYKLQIAITAITVLIFNTVIIIGTSISTRILIVSIGIFAIYLPPTIRYFAEKRHNFFRSFYVLCYAAFEILIIIRAIYIYNNPQKDFFSNSLFDSLYSISLFLLSLIGTVGFLLLVKERQDFKIRKLLNDKNQFFSIIAHDLRGPLGSSVGLAQLLNEEVEDYSREEIKEITEMLYESNKNSYKLLENLLDWARVQTGMIEFSPKKIVLNNLIQENVELNKLTALNKNIKLWFEASESVEVNADKNMIDTIVRNLLTNAIKFTGKNGEIKVQLQRKNNMAEISITDNGIGIPDNVKEKLFKINRKATQKGTNNETGSGLGLLLCNEFIAKHQGEIIAESEPGKGSVFRFTLPLPQ